MYVISSTLEDPEWENTTVWEELEEALEKWRKVADAPSLPFDKERSDVQKHKVSESGPPFE